MPLILFAPGLFQQWSVFANGWVYCFNQISSMFFMRLLLRKQNMKQPWEYCFLKKNPKPKMTIQPKLHKNKTSHFTRRKFLKYCGWYPFSYGKQQKLHECAHFHCYICSPPLLLECNTSFGMHIFRLQDWGVISATMIILFVLSWNAVVDCAITRLNP